MRYRAYSQDKGHTQVTGNSRSGCGRLFATATVMARRGRYADAIRLLEQARDADECSDAEVLDFHARIYAQQGLYLYAESCWHRAQNMDSSNPAYANALYRLRQAHQPIHYVYRIAMVSIGLLILGLLLWQIVLVNSTLRYRQEAADQSLGTIRNEIEAFHHSSLSQDEELATSLAGVARDLQNLDNRLFSRIENMPTLSGMNANHEAIIRHVNNRLNTLEKETLGQFGGAAKERSATDRRMMALEGMVTQGFAGIGKQQSTADAGQLEQFKAIKAMMEPLGEKLSGIESAIDRSVDTAESAIRQDMKSLATAGEVNSLARSISELQKEVGQLVVAIQELKQSGGEDDGKAGGGTGDTGSAEEQGTPNDGQSDDNESGESESEQVGEGQERTSDAGT